MLALPLLALAACSRGSTTAEQPRQAPGSVSIARATPTPSPTPTPPQLCLVTREKGVPPTYEPRDLVALPADLSIGGTVELRQEAAQALVPLLTAAQQEGQRIVAVSGYRSYTYQQTVLTQEIKNYGEAQARRQVAEPGHSEHQLGVAVDVTSARLPDLEDAFGAAPEGRWLAANAARFGFVISYPAGKEAITGYVYEPWHIRYVGVPLAQEVVASGLTLTEFLSTRGMGGCPDVSAATPTATPAATLPPQPAPGRSTVAPR